MDKKVKLVLITMFFTFFFLLLIWTFITIPYTYNLPQELCDELGFDDYDSCTCINYEDQGKNNFYASKVKCDYPFFTPWDSKCYLKQTPERFLKEYKIVIKYNKEVNKNG